MKKHLKLLTILIASSITLNAQTLWDDFENPSDVVYFFVNGSLIDTVNTFPNGVNSSDTCAKYTRDGSQQFAVIVTDIDGAMNDIASYTDSTLKMSMQVYSSNVGDTIQITLEDRNVAFTNNFPTGRHSEYRAITTVANQWEELEFTLFNKPDPSMSNNTLNRLVILFAPGTNSNSVYYFDSIVGPSYGSPCDTVTVQPDIFDDYECQRNTSYDFANGTQTVVTNPLQSGANTSAKCGKMKKFVPPTNDGAFGGVLDNVFTTADYKTVHISLYDPSAPSDYIVILRDANEINLFEETITTSSNSSWVEYKLDISSIPTSDVVDGWVMLINPSTATEDSIFFDNFKVSNDIAGNCAGIVEDITICEDFECQRNITYDFANGDNLVVQNPVNNGINTSSTCGKLTKWVDPDLGDTIMVPNDGAVGGSIENTFNTGDFKTVHISFLDMDAPSEVLFMVRDGNDQTLVEKTFNTSTSGVWQEYSMDISTLPTFEEIEGWVMVFNPATNTADSIYYDNFRISNNDVDNIDNNLLNSNVVSIYPNPAKNNIIVNGSSVIKNIKIVNSLGVIVSNIENNNSNKNVDISLLSSGTYIVVSTLENNEVVRSKFIK